ncbi:MAG: carbamoyltransferase C-terminal domain-containing protein, partial [Patescibacteria group bacterium]
SYFGFIRDNRQGFTPKFYEMFGPKRNKNEEITQHHMNVARAAQAALEEVVVGMVKLAKELTGEDNLCLSGGVALNSVANGKILESGLFKNIYIYPAAGDAGTGIGAALYAYYSAQSNKVTHLENQSAYLGYESNDGEILKALANSQLKYSTPTNLYEETASLLVQNKVVGWFQGRAEVGPRALGNRSILANPALAGNKDRVNNKIKFRESFRPFAPSVLSEYAKEYFEMRGADSPYMIMAFNTKEDKRNKIPAVVHVDGSARVQTVTKEQNEKYFELIEEFNRQSSIPMLLNTSFNKAGEVLVNTPEQAIAAFLGSELDVLVIDKYLIQK